jgi:hypothetical protein
VSEPKRYAILGVVVEPSYNAQEVTSEMIAVREGAWVRYEDYARLNAKADALDTEVKAMWKENRELRDRIDLLTPPLWLRVVAWLVSFVGAFWLAQILFNWMHR